MKIPDQRGFARRMAEIQSFYVMDILARARLLESQGHSIVHMEVGEPDFDTPASVAEAAMQAIQQGLTHYTPALGLPKLREAVARFYAEEYAVELGPERVAITSGASGALMLTLGVLIDRDEEVLMTDPGYPCNRHFVRLFEGHAVNIPVAAATGYQLTLDAIKSNWTKRSKAVLLASPANPTGTSIALSDLSEIVDFVAEQGGYVIVDEIYHNLVYGESSPSAVTLPGPVVVVNSFSKYFNMTGWRLGWMVAPPELIAEVDRLAQNVYLAPPTISQYAAMAAFLPENLALLEQRRRVFQQRRDYLLPALRELGFGIPIEPQGAFYLYANCERFSSDSFVLCQQLLEQAGVAVTPGIDFGEYLAAQHLRFAYTTDLAQLKEGVRRIAEFLNKA